MVDVICDGFQDIPTAARRNELRKVKARVKVVTLDFRIQAARRVYLDHLTPPSNLILCIITSRLTL